MIIKKYLHSCILVEENGKRLLIDPGLFSFVENKLKPEDIGAVDVILLTHKHPDHYYPEALKILARQSDVKILTNSEIAGLLKNENLGCEVVRHSEIYKAADFTIQAFDATHGPIPVATPHNIAFLINNSFLHPGDSLSVPASVACDVVALPVSAPWLRLVDALEWARQMKPRKVIPIHDAIMKNFMLERIYAMSKENLEKAGISFHPLTLTDALEV